MVDGGANLNVADKWGMTPANLALDNRKHKVAEYLQNREKELTVALLWLPAWAIWFYALSKWLS